MSAEGSSAAGAALLEELLEKLRRGETLDEGRLAEEHPDLAGDIRGLAAVVAFVRDAAERLDGAGPPALGDFEIRREVARGGMGVVYEARQRSLGRRVALKVLLPGVAVEPRSLERFAREARAAAAVHHGHIVPVYEVGEVGGIPYHALAFIDGSPLDEVVAEEFRDGRPPGAGAEWWRRVARWGRDIASALHAAHEQGIVHRDVKPSNILVDREGKAWITDFGLARHDANATMTRSGDLLGTLRYLPPERAGGSAAADRRADVYGLGVTLYEAVAGRPPFDGSDQPQVLRRVLESRPVPLARAAPGIPADLALVIATAMDPDPARRYATAAALAGDLDRVLEDAPPAVRRPTALDRLGRLVRRHRAATAAVAGLIVILAALAAVMSVQAARLAIHRDRIASEAARSERAGAFLASVLQLADPRSGRRQPTMEAALDDAAARIGAEVGDDPVLERTVRLVIARAYVNLSRFDEGILEMERVVELERRLSGEGARETVMRVLELSQALRQQARDEEALEQLRRTMQALDASDPLWPAVQVALGRAVAHAVRYEAGVAMVEEGVDMLRRDPGPAGEGLAAALVELACLAARRDDDDRAIVLLREAAAIRAQSGSALAAETRGQLAYHLTHRGAEGDLAEAEEHLNGAIGALVAEVGADHPDVTWHRRQLATNLASQGRAAEADRLYLDVLETHRRTLGPDHIEVARTLCVHGRWLERWGRPEEAAADYRQALEIRGRRLPAGHEEIAEAREALERLEPAGGP
jgi:tetratricopeptide (TPR) repeat protein